MQATAQIFDVIQRTERRAKYFNESSFAFYNASARRGFAAVRDLIEQWYARFPIEGKSDIRGRLRSGNETDFQSAFFELYLCELCLRLGFEVAIYPGMEQHRRSSHPDFILSRGGKPTFYLEATLAQDSQTNVAANRRVAQLQDEINRVQCRDFWLWLDISGTATVNIPVGQVRKRIDKWLATLDVDHIAATARVDGDDTLPRFCETYGDLTFTITARPKSPEVRGRIGARPLGLVSPDMLVECNAHDDIRRAVTRKANCYGRLNLPYVIAINVMDELADFDDIVDGLFGRVEVAVWQQPRGTWHRVTRRAPNGAWTCKNGSRNASVSAALIANNLMPTTIGVETPVLIHNPWGEQPFPKDAWPLPQRSVDTSSWKLVSHPGLDAREIFGLSDRWPLPD